MSSFIALVLILMGRTVYVPPKTRKKTFEKRIFVGEKLKFV